MRGKKNSQLRNGKKRSQNSVMETLLDLCAGFPPRKCRDTDTQALRKLRLLSKAGLYATSADFARRQEIGGPTKCQVDLFARNVINRDGAAIGAFGHGQVRDLNLVLLAVMIYL